MIVFIKMFINIVEFFLPILGMEPGFSDLDFSLERLSYDLLPFGLISFF